MEASKVFKDALCSLLDIGVSSMMGGESYNPYSKSLGSFSFSNKGLTQISSLRMQLCEFRYMTIKQANKILVVNDRNNHIGDNRDTRMYSHSFFLLREVRLHWRGVVVESQPMPQRSRPILLWEKPQRLLHGPLRSECSWRWLPKPLLKVASIFPTQL
jgi:hypothetical protein